jgi:hypothetical protein
MDYDGHPLAGVLDRLLARERGTKEASAQVGKAPRPRPLAVEAAEPVFVADPAARRMLVIAALGSDAGDDARRSITRWALRSGRHPAALDIGCAEQLPDPIAPGDVVPVEGPHIPLANLPAAPERLREEPAEVLAAALEQLRRLERSADLLIVRIAPRFRMALMRAAFLAGGLVVPVQDSYEVLYEAFQISREVLESFLDLAVWPAAADHASLQRYQAMMREVLDAESLPLAEDAGQSAPLFDRLSAPPEEGFLVSLVDPDTLNPPTQLLQLGSLHI